MKTVIPEILHGDCREDVNVTTGLIDAIISISRVLAPRLKGKLEPEIIAALADLADDEDMAHILGAAYSIPGADFALRKYEEAIIEEGE
ncbi:MAG: hypothetical protein GWO41_03905 [candidate division Zixibacteria bacterium]|nr:hypothetical protein [candidate division Zixibacteria bacterium]NIW39777.1 hypothetical protein [candidate division Zixibacteria bacterium]NIX54691.1 hypothetical protein [candidate division Zixibacteria bacterium]